MKKRILSMVVLITLILGSISIYATSFLPTSGWETEFDADYWNESVVYRWGPNCYFYALNYRTSPITGESLLEADPLTNPGAIAYELNKSTKKNYIDYSGSLSKKIETAFFADMSALGRSVRTIGKYEKSSNGYRKIALYIDSSGDSGGFHFIRQDESGYWSQKANSTAFVTMFDSSGDYIVDPDKADLSSPSGTYTYDVLVGYYEIYWH